ncbi:hypothetical protein [Natrinema halophilum]|uniref:Uncharacterized protein n=1 Tax=Natrinema halophilum TaxID=1699371 RepID=A0A7D5KJB6_9EURY|nr:hypothetical protein [Natrinema halophilum]QLG49319.1 hypothetical protein HYG82_10820 [Natrinema halophilum]
MFSILETQGYSHVLGERLTNVQTATDKNALLGITGANDTSITPTFTNNTNRHMDVTLDSAEAIELDVGNDGNWVSPPTSFPLVAGESKEVNIRYLGVCTSAGWATVDITGGLADGSGNTVGSVHLSRDFKISEAGQVQFTGTAKSAGSSGKYEFEIENTGCSDVTWTGVGINETTTGADYVSGKGSLFNKNTKQELVTDQIPIDSGNPESDTRRDFNQSVQLLRNDPMRFEFREFMQTASGNGKGNKDSKVDMQGEDIRITLYLSDGSSAIVKLCLGTCDFN